MSELSAVKALVFDVFGTVVDWRTSLITDFMWWSRQRGISAEDAVSMIVSGFCREVFRELPMEFAVEAQKLLGVSLEGSVG